MNTVQHLEKHNLTMAPNWLAANVHYECIMGSVAYGCSSDTSDMDIYGFCIPPKEIIFPHLAGEIFGFGNHIHRFDQYQVAGIVDKDALNGKGRTYDLSIYNIVKYFQLCMDNNPNMIDSLFVPSDCVLSITQIGNIVREKRDLFLHKGCWFKFKGYAYSQVHKMKTKNPEGKRKDMIDKYGYDIKFAYHVVRLLNEVEIILTEGTLDLRRNSEQLKSIRRGDWKMEEIEEYFTKKERELETLYTNSKLRYFPDEQQIKDLLLNCLEQHYGNLSNCVAKLNESDIKIQKIKEILNG